MEQSNKRRLIGTNKGTYEERRKIGRNKRTKNGREKRRKGKKNIEEERIFIAKQKDDVGIRTPAPKICIKNKEIGMA